MRTIREQHMLLSSTALLTLCIRCKIGSMGRGKQERVSEGAQRGVPARVLSQNKVTPNRSSCQVPLCARGWGFSQPIRRLVYRAIQTGVDLYEGRGMSTEGGMVMDRGGAGLSRATPKFPAVPSMPPPWCPLHTHTSVRVFWLVTWLNWTSPTGSVPFLCSSPSCTLILPSLKMKSLGRVERATERWTGQI